MNEFTKATAIRAIRTMAQTAIATIGSAAIIADVDWQIVLSASVLSGILSILTSIATGLPEVESAAELTEDEYTEDDTEGDDDGLE